MGAGLSPEDLKTKARVSMLSSIVRRVRGRQWRIVPHPGPIATEQRTADKSGALRAAIFGANDGLVSSVSLIMGVAGAGVSNNVIVLAGVAGLVGGGGLVVRDLLDRRRDPAGAVPVRERQRGRRDLRRARLGRAVRDRRRDVDPHGPAVLPVRPPHDVDRRRSRARHLRRREAAERDHRRLAPAHSSVTSPPIPTSCSRELRRASYRRSPSSRRARASSAATARRASATYRLPRAVSRTTLALASSTSGTRRTYPRFSRSSTISIMPCFVIRARRASSVRRVPERRSMFMNTAACAGRASG